MRKCESAGNGCSVFFISKIERLILDGQILSVAVQITELFWYPWYFTCQQKKVCAPPQMVEGKNSLAPTTREFKKVKSVKSDTRTHITGNDSQVAMQIVNISGHHFWHYNVLYIFVAFCASCSMVYWTTDRRFHKSYDVKCRIVFLGNSAKMAARVARRNVNIGYHFEFLGELWKGLLIIAYISSNWSKISRS